MIILRWCLAFALTAGLTAGAGAWEPVFDDGGVRVWQRPYKSSPLLEVRGEVLIGRKRFERFNAQREASGQPRLANARNAVAGALRRNDPSEVARYPLEFHAWSAPRAEGERGSGDC